MRKGLIVGYGFALVISFGMQSCQDDPITPNGNGNGIDTTWVNDTTGGGNGGGTPIDSTWNGGGNPMDTLGGN